MVTLSSIPGSTTSGPNANLSSDEGFDKVLEDSEDKPVMKKRVSDSNKDDGGEHEIEAMGICLLPLSDLLPYFFYW